MIPVNAEPTETDSTFILTGFRQGCDVETRDTPDNGPSRFTPVIHPVMKLRQTASWIFTVLVSLLFLATASAKLLGQFDDLFVAWGYPAWLAIVVGIAETVGAIAFLFPKTFRTATFLLGAILFGALITHVVNFEWVSILRPFLFGVSIALAVRLRIRETSTIHEPTN